MRAGKLNNINSSVPKFCKALIIQDAARYPNYTNNFLRKSFFIAGWFCCIVLAEELSYRNDSKYKSIYTILKRRDI